MSKRITVSGPNGPIMMLSTESVISFDSIAARFESGATVKAPWTLDSFILSLENPLGEFKVKLENYDKGLMVTVGEVIFLGNFEISFAELDEDSEEEEVQCAFYLPIGEWTILVEEGNFPVVKVYGGE